MQTCGFSLKNDDQENENVNRDGKMNEKVDEYMEKQSSPQKEICLELRRIIFQTFLHLEEEMKWSVPTYARDKHYIVALKEHVNMGFSLKGLSKEEQTLL